MEKVPSLLQARPTPADHVLINITRVKEKMGWSSDSTVYDYIHQRGFPVPFKGSRRNARWMLSEVDAYIEAMPRSFEKKAA